jgi:hypothetical protein
MNSLGDLIKKENKYQHILTAIFIIYLILGAKTPLPVATLVDNIIGQVVVISIAILLFVNSNPILGVIGIFVAFDLIRRSSLATGTHGLFHYLPSEHSKMSHITSYNKIPYTLEQEIVNNMAPITNNSTLLNKSSYVPILEKNHGAASLSE